MPAGTGRAPWVVSAETVPRLLHLAGCGRVPRVAAAQARKGGRSLHPSASSVLISCRGVAPVAAAQADKVERLLLLSASGARLDAWA